MRASEHLLIALLLLGFPVYVAIAHRGFERALRDGDAGARLRDYRRTMVALWGMTLLALGLWWWRGGAWEVLGLTLPPGGRSLVGAALTLVLLGFLALQQRALRHLGADGREELGRRMGAVAEYLPRTPTEYRGFQALGITAGLCEELLYRGFLLAYLEPFVGPWLAVVLGALGFAAVHSYQGVAGVVRTGLIGLALGALYTGTGSLLWPVLIHAAVDLQAGAAGWALRGPSLATTASRP
ncbi:CPBP family intramembrane glutamic endopeptidase [Myxococcus sp. CA040A]|uniref:CPBP family intramembrane glutamic endopeptidase n=1 Tax=Myxococcus sp. CA040A TaxID=2741738 RepID=UPI00157A5AD4|nr:type II CAAX endopeptidase family protein [Myxococcus sp. CA040A]NTX08594.1 CPBP family intramembrane metalloprotease [Myxococcus sp. CA040A]